MEVSGFRQVLIILALCAMGGGAWWFLARPDVVPAQASGGNAARVSVVPVEVASVQIGEIQDAIEAVGTARARQSIDLVANVTGRMTEILFQAGQEVDRGQPLARLDDAIESANLAEARALLGDARAQFERARQLVANRNVSQARVDELEAAYAAARARVQAAERRLDERIVRAPFRGVVGLREIDVGARVEEDTKITRLEDRSLMELQFQVPELFYGQIRTGQQVRARSASLPGKVFLGTVTAIDMRIDEVSRAFRVRAELPNPEGMIPAGLFMVVEIVLASRPSVVLVPEQAIVPEGRSNYVFRVRGDRVERVEVQLGQRRVGEVEVVNGLNAGDSIVTAGVQRLRSGSPIRILNATSDAVGEGSSTTAGAG
ncbi:MAG: efflux RND transporter periplasmic adaptor subunit [Rhodospirillales bacterium]|jgi:membrane fusion protein (multidrug efflux system)|nr:efflux RND transporter periplasmic adaptor subunit [Rhodospirillales bacterium]